VRARDGSTDRVRVALFYTENPNVMVTADTIRWVEMAVHLRRLGHEVALVTPAASSDRHPYLSANHVDVALPGAWDEYDVVVALLQYSARHIPESVRNVVFDLHQVVSFTAPLVEDHQAMAELVALQDECVRRAAAISVTAPGHLETLNLLYPDIAGKPVVAIPCGSPSQPPDNTYAQVFERPAVLFAGSFHHEYYADVLNALGPVAADLDARLYVLGPGPNAHRLDSSSVTYLGPADYSVSNSLMSCARIGLAFPQYVPTPNPVESTKVWCYLRYGVPTIEHSSIWNADVIEELDFGRVVAEFTPDAYADALCDISLGYDRYVPRRDVVAAYMLRKHGWDVRARAMETLLKQVVEK